MVDKQNEFETFATIESAPSSTVFNKPRTRKSGNVKLRFHHQAIPQEYLEHYEASQNQVSNRCDATTELTPKPKSTRKSRTPTTITSTGSDTADKTDQSIQMWLQKVGEPLEKEKKHEFVNNQMKNAPKLVPTTKLTAQDLPYMGEITLDNFKPRRGRKPKKADICHLIYKNYGTVLQQKPDEEETECVVTKSSTKDKTISSLLQKRLTQDDINEKDGGDGKTETEEPLNLCVRDRFDCDIMTIISSDDANECEKLTDFKSEIGISHDLVDDSHFSRNLKMSLPNFQAALLENKLLANDCENSGMDSPGYYNNWPNSPGLLLNPSMAMYLQKIALNGTNEMNPDGSAQHNDSIEKTIDSAPVRKLLIPKKISQLLKTDNSSNNKSSTASSPSPKTIDKNATKTPKRKRSAIFIPPLPDESSTNHATEVSICKFKFTGGAKPSLQEKKMLSVDAGGNFRFYSGTGDKSIRGYEFFPRESLQQSSSLTCSSAGAFLNTPGQKVNDLPPPSFGMNNELLQIPEANASKPSSSSSVPLTERPNNSRKRKSKRSMQIQKLEKTFKEKGFLIQTQQLEQAEGTYCKFRQLRKFTRYLFRSWKDYLPGELQQNPAILNPSTVAAEHDDLVATTSNFLPSPSSSHDE